MEEEIEAEVLEGVIEYARKIGVTEAQARELWELFKEGR